MPESARRLARSSRWRSTAGSARATLPTSARRSSRVATPQSFAPSGVRAPASCGPFLQAGIAACNGLLDGVWLDDEHVRRQSIVEQLDARTNGPRNLRGLIELPLVNVPRILKRHKDVSD